MHSRWQYRSFLVLLLCVVSSLSSQCFAQAASEIQSDPAGTIDGSRNPELIPDAIAYRLFFTTVSASSHATDVQRRRQKAQLMPIGLTDSDKAILITGLTDYGDRLALLSQLSPSAPRVDSVVRAASDLKGILSAKMTPDGLQKLDAFIQKEKKHMKLFPVPLGMTTGN